MTNLEKYGQSLIGKYAQSRLLTGLTANGKQYILPAQKITGYEIVECFKEPTLIVIIDGESIFENLLFNIH